VLDWYRRHTDADGLPAKMPFWNITDWCPWWPRGVVPGADTGPTCIHAAQYINALDEAAWLSRRFGRTGRGRGRSPPRPRTCGQKAHARFWSESEGLYFDRPGGPEVSQYGNAWAIVAGLAGERERALIMRRFPNDAKLAPVPSSGCTPASPRCTSGRYDDMPQHLGPWHESVGYGLSTFVEENSYWRSLCHAWSAHPVLEFQQRILGVTPAEPGFARIAIAAQPLRPHPRRGQRLHAARPGPRRLARRRRQIPSRSPARGPPDHRRRPRRPHARVHRPLLHRKVTTCHEEIPPPHHERRPRRLPLCRRACSAATSTPRPAIDLKESPKPYFHPVNSLAGDTLTNFRPNDHAWHHGAELHAEQRVRRQFLGRPDLPAADGYKWRDDHGAQQHVAWSKLKVGNIGDARAHAGMAPPGRGALPRERTLTITVNAAANAPGRCTGAPAHQHQRTRALARQPALPRRTRRFALHRPAVPRRARTARRPPRPDHQDLRRGRTGDGVAAVHGAPRAGWNGTAA
jgi:hypothetical protein